MAAGWFSGVGRWLLGRLGVSAAETGKPGGTFRRALTWARVYRRAMAWDRVWRYRGVANTFPAQELAKTPGESRVYLFDFSKAPEVAAGETLSSPDVAGGSGLTFGTPAVTAGTLDGIAAGKAVQVRISGGTDDVTYSFSVSAQTSGGSTLELPARMAVAERE